MTSSKLTTTFQISNPIQFLALGFGSGLAPKAPGTFGTLAAVPLYLLVSGFNPIEYAILVLIMSIAGVYICGKAASDVGVHDHPAIVWDEFVGFFITMFMVPISWQSVAVGFILFRLFDIVKPWPISIADKKLTGGFGIMFDDILAGLASLAIMLTIF